MIVTVNSPTNSVLREKTIPVISGDQAVAAILALEHEMGGLPNAVGLSGPQIGLSLSVAIIRHNGVRINLINPSIIGGGNEFTSHKEGCVSFPGRCFEVPRFGVVRIKNHILWPAAVGSVPVDSDVNRKPIDRLNPPKGMTLVPVEQVYVYENPVEDHGGIIAVAVQHEIDHLFGVTIDSKEGSKEHYEMATGDNKVGRNDPCPCGKKDAAGNPVKFKKCCFKM